jgi:hypothetical protein
MRRSLIVTGGVVVVLLIAAVGIYALFLSPAPRDVTVVDESGSTWIDEPTLITTLGQMSAGNLSEAEEAGLLYMREEEKLAHDVYSTLYEQWNLPIFANIAASEQTHTDAVKTLIERYGLEDPATGVPGTFSNAEIQGLYDALVTEGRGSLRDALEVGAAIEELDILDLQNHLAETDKGDIQLVYENLMKGSRNHLRAFVSTLAQQGYDYTPRYLSQEEYEQITGSSLERGRGRSWT